VRYSFLEVRGPGAAAGQLITTLILVWSGSSWPRRTGAELVLEITCRRWVAVPDLRGQTGAAGPGKPPPLRPVTQFWIAATR
jgi:hypothetical protein